MKLPMLILKSSQFENLKIALMTKKENIFTKLLTDRPASDKKTYL